MSHQPSQLEQEPGARLRSALRAERPLQVAGTINAYCALLAQHAGFRAIYLSGAGVANATLGLPDLGVIHSGDVICEASRITSVTSLPLIVDCDTGWGNALTIRRAVRELSRQAVAGIHLEDQVDSKRCGHRPGKQLVPVSQMQDRLKAALDSRLDPSFFIMARTDAVGVSGLDEAIDRAAQYEATGADGIFAEALGSLEDYRRFAGALSVPVLANMTEFGKTPLFSLEELRDAGIGLVLYPLSAFRAMSASALAVYQAIRTQGTQRDVIGLMQTRDELYEMLDYHTFEQKLNERQLGEDEHVRST